MFGSRLDIEHAFGHHGLMGRTRVRRRRLVALWAAIGLVGVLSGPVAHAVGVGGTQAARTRRTYVVRSGDTLWSIARSLHTTGDVRVTVKRLAAANGGSTLRVGDRLVVP